MGHDLPARRILPAADRRLPQPTQPRPAHARSTRSSTPRRRTSRPTPRARSGRSSTAPGSCSQLTSRRPGDVRPQRQVRRTRPGRSWRSSSSCPSPARTAEFSVLKSGPSKGDAGGSEPQISVGYVPDTDVPQAPSLRAQGYRAESAFYPYGFDYFEPNFNNPEVGPILRQLYFRQAFQHLVDQQRLDPCLLPGPRRARPTARFRRSRQTHTRTRSRARIRTRSASRPPRASSAAHGWKVVPDGITTCARPRHRRR